ncbi:DUF4855 domain-containing protein [Bacillus sp. REN10]|uniref:DUF4855 domain-containing protein n=1 Tax=Bacillus sp. REN10 TaxID=2782541 RepID=UPI00193AFCE2|nr:DUF4855 domain-containing protein [Bacillus sp. REN10]
MFFRRLLVTMIALFSVFGLASQSMAQTPGFTDIKPSHPAYDHIQFISSYNIISGFTDGQFKPDEQIKRKDAAVMMVRALEILEAPEEPMTFTDVTPTSPGYKEISIAMANGWFTLTEDGAFEPDKPLTRDEMAKALAVAFSYEGKETSTFIDVSKDDPYYPYIDAINYYNVSKGYKVAEGHEYRPSEVVTRVQFAIFLSRVFQQPSSYEVRNAGQVVATHTSLEAALDEVANYPQGTIHPASTRYRKFDDKIAMEDRTGIKSSVLIYNGKGEKDTFTKEYFDKYTKYSTPDGKTGDFFNTFVILALRYDGGWFTDEKANKANYAEWQTHIDRTFAEDGALQQLNASAGDQSKKVDVYIGIPYPKRSEPIIKLDGEEVENSLDARMDMVNWYISEVSEMLNQSHFENLNFKGYYWTSETVRAKEDEQLLPAVAERIHQDSKYFIYSPHATSTNFHKWKSYGFDAAFLQPNAFRSNVPDKEKRLHQAFLKAQMYGAGINIEINSYSQSQAKDGVEAFNLYIDYSKRYGLNEYGMMFYQGINMVERMATYDHPIFQDWYKQLTSTFF